MSTPGAAFEAAKEHYRALGVDVERALATLAAIPLSIHCWQGDDVGGFERAGAQLEGGGIQVTGNYPGKARTVEELRGDLEAMYGLLPGKHRLALHMSYGEFGGRAVDRDQVEPSHFRGWIDWAKAKGLKLDMNSTFFSHPKAADGFTLSSKNKGVRDFWIEHAKRTREVSAIIGKELGSACIHNVWIPDGMKDYPADRIGYRRILEHSLDEIFEKEYPSGQLKDAVESKLFGLGSEAYVVGSHEFYLGYAITRRKLLTLDMGHFHPTESVSDKVSAILLYCDELLLHVSRPMRWDSDHVVVLNDELRFLAEEIVASGRLPQIHVGLDFFDATINRVGAWTIGARSMLKALLAALLAPRDRLLRAEEEGDWFARLQLLEQAKSLPLGAVWDYYCAAHGAPLEQEIIDRVHVYERNVLSKRA